MNANGRPRYRSSTPAVEPTSLTEITRRYYATAIALAKAMGVPMSETFLQAHRESISCCFIEAGRAGVRLPVSVSLPPLASATCVTSEVETASVGLPLDGASVPHGTPPPEPNATTHPPGEGEAHDGGDLFLSDSKNSSPPSTIPAGLPCAGQRISALKPAALAMLIARAANLVHEEGPAWVPLLGALQVERAARIERGRRPKVVTGKENGHGA